MSNTNNIETLKRIIKQPKYFILGLGVAIVIFIVNLILNGSQALTYALTKIGISSNLINQWNELFLKDRLFCENIVGAQTLASSIKVALVLNAVIAILIGIVIALIVFKAKNLRASWLKGNKTASIGTLLGIVVPSCASCGLGFLSLIGLGGYMIYLPFQGIEIAIASIFLLLISMHFLLKDIGNCPTCKVELAKK